MAASGFTKEMKQDLEWEEVDENSEDEYASCDSDHDDPQNGDGDKEIPNVSSLIIAEKEETKKEENDTNVSINDWSHEKDGNDASSAVGRQHLDSFCGGSVRSVSTVSTIAPEVIRSKVKQSLARRERQELRKRIVAKGEASATTRSRRENKATIQEFSDFDLDLSYG